jgi:hypothetical protein
MKKLSPDASATSTRSNDSMMYRLIDAGSISSMVSFNASGANAVPRIGRF